jgi:threonine/homoserine/homoserine lactone efflux protein
VPLADLAAALGIGLALGMLTGMPLGVINVAIVDAALARESRYARGLGIGGALADTAHALLAFVGLAHVVTARPALERALAIVAAVVIIAHAVMSWRRHRSPTATSATQIDSTTRGIASGVALTLPNPAALGAWVAVAVVLWPSASTSIAIALAVGVGIGSAAWFVMLARLVARVSPDHRALRFVPRVALVLFVGIAALALVRAFH